MSRRLDDLSHTTMPLVVQVERAMEALGFSVGRACTYRSVEEQEANYAKGRTAPGPIITKTRRGWHNLTELGKPASRAVDWFFIPQPGRFPDRRTGFEREWPWELLRACAEAVGLKRTLRWDKGHFVDSRGESFSEAWAQRS